MTQISHPSRSGARPSMALASVADLETRLGEALRAQRLERNLEQATLAERAGVSVNVVKRLESGQGSSVHSLLAVLRALGRESWLNTLAPVATINPLTLPRAAKPRQRVRSKNTRG
jgi:transcriptional regulator with XRE-family HTH domain